MVTTLSGDGDHSSYNGRDLDSSEVQVGVNRSGVLFVWSFFGTLAALSISFDRRS